MLNYEEQFYNNEIKLIAGTDEAGRGPLCGPVVAASIILPKDYHNELINDSKKLTEKQREKAFLDIIKNAIAYGIGYVDSAMIDKINIYEASRKAMLIALNNMKIKPDFIITDCMPLKFENTNVLALPHGDALCECIAAASILAKVCRDHYMNLMDKKYPQYDFKHNKGYGTKKHLEALDKYGPIKGFHRYSYGPVSVKKMKLF